MIKLVKEKSFYAGLLSIALPIAVQQLIQFGVSMTDTVMLGQLGDVQLSASAQANQPLFVFQLIVFGLGGGGSVLASQYWGKRDAESVRRIIGIVLKIAIICSLVFTLTVKAFPQRIMELYLKNETEKDALIISEAIDYLNIVGWGYFFFGVSMSLQNTIRSAEIVKISMVTSSAGFVVNFILNRILIFGTSFAPAMGIKGAATATLIARIVDFTLTVCYVFFIDKKLKFRLKYIFIKNDGALISDFIHYSLPVLMNEFMWGLGISVQAAILGRISPEVVAAYSIVSVLQNLATIVIFGIANSAAVVIGKQIGGGDREGAKRSSATIMAMAVILGFFGMAVMLLLRKWFVSIYNVGDEVRALAENLLAIMSVILIFVSIAATAIVGVLRGAGDTKFAMKLEFVTLWLIAVPLGAILGFVFRAPILLVCAALKVDEPIKAVIASVRTSYDNTYKDVTR